ncbi:thiamine phosphate synthase [Crenobacter sp. SG2303]|uniref:Thiamine-phosphate synthase n=1 Tax=Crenobacter oryzisoli TaxID=3056844 RepID=A0ABT7XTX2_9NEIS|nr:thiamine phosphate synthase [Crenobacter sp. SG2303]MDN0077241.1 thiamine phosphate synthase [Crenobacter sp. SG2303]
MKPDFDLSLYLVLDPDMCGGHAAALRTADLATRNGATVVQLRAPEWKKRAWLALAVDLKALLAPRGVPLIINDHVDIALAADADGVHVGQKDLPAHVVRRLIGPNKLLGLSTSSLADLRGVDADLVDYIGVGPVYPTGTKEDANPVLGVVKLAQLLVEKPLPAVAIGGIGIAQAAEVIGAGADGVAVVSAICAATDPAAASVQLGATIASAREVAA